MNTLFLSGNHTDFFVSFGDNITDQIIRTFYVFHYHRRNLLTACKPVGNHCGNGKVFGNDVDQALMGSHVDDSLYLLCKKLLDFLPHNFLVAGGCHDNIYPGISYKGEDLQGGSGNLLPRSIL